jgi:hypothetical protein
MDCKVLASDARTIYTILGMRSPSNGEPSVAREDFMAQDLGESAR